VASLWCYKRKQKQAFCKQQTEAVLFAGKEAGLAIAAGHVFMSCEQDAAEHQDMQTGNESSQQSRKKC